MRLNLHESECTALLVSPGEHLCDGLGVDAGPKHSSWEQPDGRSCQLRKPSPIVTIS